MQGRTLELNSHYLIHISFANAAVLVRHFSRDIIIICIVLNMSENPDNHLKGQPPLNNESREGEQDVKIEAQPKSLSLRNQLQANSELPSEKLRLNSRPTKYEIPKGKESINISSQIDKIEIEKKSHSSEHDNKTENAKDKLQEFMNTNRKIMNTPGNPLELESQSNKPHLENSTGNIDLQTEFEQIMKETKMEQDGKQFLTDIVNGHLSVQKVADEEIIGLRRNKFKTLVHKLMKDLSVERMKEQKTREIKQLCLLFSQYGISKDLIKLPIKQLSKLDHGLSEQEWTEFAERNKYIEDNFRKISVNFNIEDELTKILREAGINDVEDIRQCKMLFKDKKIEELSEIPSKRKRQKMKQDLLELLSKIDTAKSKAMEQQQEEAISQDFIALLQSAKMGDKEDIEDNIKLFNEQRYDQIKSNPAKKYRATFSAKLDEIIRRNNILNQLENNSAASVPGQLSISDKANELMNVNQQQQLNDQKNKESNGSIQQQSLFKERNLKQIFQEYHSQAIQNHAFFEKKLEVGDFSFLVELPSLIRKQILSYAKDKYIAKRLSLKQKLILTLTPLLSDEQIIEVIQGISQAKPLQQFTKPQITTIVEKIKKEYDSQIILKYSIDKEKSIHLNELSVPNVQQLKKKIEKAMKIVDLSDYYIFLDQIKIKLNDLVFEPTKTYVLHFFEIKEYRWNYGGKIKKINLLLEKNVDYNKRLIFEELISQNELVYDEVEPFNMENLIMKFQTREEVIQNISDMTLMEIQAKRGGIIQIFVSAKLKIIVFYQDRSLQFWLSSSSRFIELRTILNDRHVPFKSQILNIIKGGNQYEQIDETKDDKFLSSISPQWNIVFQLINRCSFEFYGFHENVHLSFQVFSQFFVENDDITSRLIKNCSFSNRKQQEVDFIQHFFSYVYSGIKKRFPIKSLIDKFKKYVYRLRSEEIWHPSTQNQTIKVNEAFVLSYMLKNADSRLRIELMNLLKDNMTIPLYFHKYDNISKVEPQFEANKQLLWILKEGYTVTSLGLHNNSSTERQTGKSSLLNDIFPAYFEQTQNKHAIIRGIPYISVRVLQNNFPMHVIDIPHDCPSDIVEEILKVTNLVIIQSWQDQEHSEGEMRRIKELYKIPSICLIRDCKDHNSLKSLKGNYIAKGRPQKLVSLSKKDKFTQLIAILKEQIFNFIENNLKNKTGSNKILELYEQAPIYQQFKGLINQIEKRIFDLAPIGKQMKKIKQLQKIYRTKQAEKIKKSIPNIIRQQVLDIIVFLLKPEVIPSQDLMLSLLRQKLKTFQNEHNLKYLKIYQHRDFFIKQIKEELDEPTKKNKILQLNDKLQHLKDLKPKSVISQDDRTIEQIIQNMINVFENQIKPEIFSIELFWRQLNYLAITNEDYEIADESIGDILTELKEKQIKSSFPFEIIDGDLLEMPRKLMKNIFENKQDRAIVLTILGPQSSGKSTLLNFLFGCDFATSEGRCTRGVYGTYFKFSQNRGYFNNMLHCEGIFVIDTEGLFALTNEKDKHDKDRKDFDSKLVLFCLAVSDFIVLNVRGNIDKNTEKIFRLCHQRLEDLKIDKQRSPEIVVVLNQNASDRKQESQNQFKQIRKTIYYDIGVSLSLAYQIKNYGHQEISILDKNQTLTKKYPLESFLKQTSSLMKDILNKIIKKKRNMCRLQETMEKFERIWSVVVIFPNLTVTVSNEQRNLQKKIKEWKDSLEEENKNSFYQMLEDFKMNKLTEDIIQEQLKASQKKIQRQFEQQFPQNHFDCQSIRLLLRQEKNKITQNSLAFQGTIRHQMENIRLSKRVNLSKIEGDFILKDKARKIMQDKKKYSEKQLRQIFDKYFQQQLDKIQKATDLGEEIKKEYRAIRDHYLHLIREQNEIGLPNEQQWFGDEKCDIKTMLKIIKEKLIEPNQSKYEDVLVHTNKEHTNVLKGGKTDASLQYFSMKDYFKTKKVNRYYQIDPSKISGFLKKDLLQSMYKSLLENSLPQGNNIDQNLSRIWNIINEALNKIGLRFTNFEHFKQLFYAYEGKILTKIKNFILGSAKNEIQFEVIESTNEIKDVQRNDKMIDQNPTTRNSKVCKQHNHKFPIFLNQLAHNSHDNICICSCLNKKRVETYWTQRLYHHINWKTILEEVRKPKSYQERLQRINQDLHLQINKDLATLNLEIVEQPNWKNILFPQPQTRKYYLMFGVIKDECEIQSFDKILSKIQQTQFINVRQFRDALKSNFAKAHFKNGNLPIFFYKTQKLQPKTKNQFFQNYLQSNTHFTIHQLKKPQFKEYIFKQLKCNQQRQSLNRFYQNIFKIVQSVIVSWQKLEKKTFIDILNKVNQEIAKFNNDLNQISCNLSQKYIGYMHAAIIYMIWKLVIDKKIKQKRQVYETKKKQENTQWQMFKARTSNDEDINVDSDIKQFGKEFVKLIQEIVQKKKRQIMKQQKKEFAFTNTRDKIQDIIDMNIFSRNSSQEVILDYLQFPQNWLEKKYYEHYQLSWKNVEMNFSSHQISSEIFKQFYQLLLQLEVLLDKNNFDDSKRDLSDFFTICQQQSKIQNAKTNQGQFKEEGKRVLFEYFIDTLLCQDPEKVRKCSDLAVKPITPLNIVIKASKTMVQNLQRMKGIKSLSLTNFVKFIKKLISQEVKTKLTENADKACKLVEKDKLQYFDKIKVVICKEKCPCCGRICGLQNNAHKKHQCIYGHQMRGLNGCHLKPVNGVKQASVIRCEHLAQTDEIEYNGKVYTWFQFKQYWKNKGHGAWSYDDIKNSKNSKKQIFDMAWTIAGPLYCDKKGYKYVSFNQVSTQKTSSQPIHYIFALDSSGSMMGKPWQNLKNSFAQTIKRISSKDLANRSRVSTIIFSTNASISCENVLSKDVNTNNLVFSSGNTNFEPPFALAAQLAEKYIDKFVILFIFMTDGYAPYPSNSIKKLKNIQANHPGKLHYAGIELASDVKDLKEIASQLKGKTGVAYNPEELTELFIRSIEVVEYREEQ